MALSPDEKFIYVNPDTTTGEYNAAQYFPVKYLRGLECAVATHFYIYFRGPKDATSTRVTVNITSGFIKDFFIQFVDEVNFGENAVITLADRNASVDATTGGTDFQHVNAFVVPVILSDVTTSGHEDVQVAEDLDVAGTITGDLTGDVTGTASVATTVTVADESTDTSCFPLFSTAATGNLEPKSGSNLTFNSSSGLLTATSLAGTLTTAAQTNITSLGTLTALDVDDINLNGKTITITGDTDDTFSIVAGANGATTLTTVDTASNTANFEIAADGNITLDAAGDIALEAAGNDITMDADTLTIESSSFLSPFVTIKSTGNNALAGYLSFSKQRADDSPADSDAVGNIVFVGEDAAGAAEQYSSIVASIVESDHGDEAGKIQILVANDGTERNGITMSGDKGTASEVDVTIANGAASVTTIAGTLTMGSTAFVDNSGVVQVATQGTIDHDSLANFVPEEHVDWAGSSAGTIHSSNVPTLNQNTTGSAATLTTPRAINGVNFDGSAPITVTAAGSTLSDTVTVAKGGTGLTTVAANTILTGNGTGALTSEANFTFSGNRVIIGNDDEITPVIRFVNDENTVDVGISDAADNLVAGSADGDFVINCTGDHNIIIGQNDLPALTVDTNGDSNFNRRFTVTGNTDGTYEGDIVYFGGTTSMTIGTIYHYKSDGTWEVANANAVATSDGLLGVALGAASDTNGMLLRGMVTLDHDPGAVGDVLYLSNTNGDASATAPSDNNDIVRVIGYCLHASNGQIWFNPDSTFVEVTA